MSLILSSKPYFFKNIHFFKMKDRNLYYSSRKNKSYNEEKQKETHWKQNSRENIYTSIAKVARRAQARARTLKKK